MEFCSEYGYDYGFDGSDSEDYEDEDEKTKEKIKRKIRKANTNIVACKFDKLIAPNQMFAGEPKSCKKCTAMMSCLSEKNIEIKDDSKIWKCEFCFELNDVTHLIDDINEIPKVDDVTFMLEAPKPKIDSEAQVSANATSESSDNTFLSFCIDVSGSMNGAIPLKEGDNLPTTSANRKRNHSYMTRLQGVQAACMQTIKTLKQTSTEKRVSLLTFSDTVKFYGDTTKNQNGNPIISFDGNSLQASTPIAAYEPVVNAAELDGKKERVLNLAANADDDLKNILQTCDSLDKKIKSLKTEGSTALGPALLFSIGFASKKLGSSVILCTDGCANKGIGSIELGYSASENALAESEKFYDDVADYAKEKGVTVNVISMEGTDCKLSVLGRVADRSNGTLSIVNPLNLAEEFKSILDNRIVAINVNAKLIVNHKYLYIRDEKIEEDESSAIDANDAKAKEELNLARQSVIVKNIGNANIDTEITFEYGLRKLDNKEDKQEVLTELPFQLQITYTLSDGSKAVRVYTQTQKFTKNREIAERNLKSKELVYVHGCQRTSDQMKHSNYKAAKMRCWGERNLIARNQQLQQQQPQIYLQQQQQITLSSKDAVFSLHSDKDATDVYQNARITRSKLSKE